jgi:hypothetical protein
VLPPVLLFWMQLVTMTQMSELEAEWTQLVGTVALACVHEPHGAVVFSLTTLSDGLRDRDPGLFDPAMRDAIVDAILKRTREIQRSAVRGSLELH